MADGTTDVSMQVEGSKSVVIKAEDLPLPKPRSWLNGRLKISVIDPEGRLYGYWQVTLLIAISVGCILTVYQGLVYSGYLSFWVIVYAVDALNLLDTVSTVNVGFYDMTGTLVKDRVLIWRRYLRSFFILDVASLVPIELFSLLFTARVMSLARFRMNRLIGLVKAYNIIGNFN